jgi:hypothetical protein
MRDSLCILLFLLLTVPSFAWQHPLKDTIPLKDRDLVPFTLKLPRLPTKDSAREAAPKKNLLIFPFAVSSLETSWGFGGIAARFFKMDKHDTTSRTSDVNVLGLYTFKRQLILVLNSTMYFPKEDRIARFQASYSYYPDKFWGLSNHTTFTAEEPFTQKQFFINPQFLQRVHRNMYLGLTYEFQITGPVSYIPGGAAWS